MTVNVKATHESDREYLEKEKIPFLLNKVLISKDPNAKAKRKTEFPFKSIFFI